MMNTELGQRWLAATTDEERAAILAKYKSDLSARRELAKPMMAAWRKGDIAACERAQTAFRAVFKD